MNEQGMFQAITICLVMLVHWWESYNIIVMDVTVQRLAATCVSVVQRSSLW